MQPTRQALLVLLLALLAACSPKLERMEDVAGDAPHWCGQERPAHVVVARSLAVACHDGMQTAVDFWADQGVSYLTFAVVDDEELTPGNPNPLFIQVINQPPEDPGAAGDTRIHRITADCIDAAEIRFDPFWCNKGNTEAHETGHALGLSHVNESDNLMWPANLPGGYKLTAAQKDQVR